MALAPFTGDLDEGSAPPPAAPPTGVKPFTGALDGEDRSAAGEIYTGLKRGVMVDLPSVAGHVMQSGELLGAEPGPISAYGKRLASEADERGKQPDYALQPEKHNMVTNALTAGAEMLPQVAAPIAAAAIAPEGAVAGGAAALAGAVPFALSAGHETLEKARAKGVSEDDALAAARENALAQGALMTVGGAATGKALSAGGKLLGRAASPLAEAADTSIMRPALAATGEAAVTNTAMLAGQGAATAGIEQAHGIDTTSPGEAALEALPGALGMTALLAPFGFAGAARLAHQKQRVIDTLKDPQADPAARLKAAMDIHGAIAANDPDAAQFWDANAADAITSRQPIDLDDSFISGRKAFEASPSAPAEPIPEEPEAPVSTVDPSMGPLSQAAALSEQHTLPAFPFASPDAARRSLEGRGPAPEGWEFDVQRHPSVVNRWAVTLKEAEKEDENARPLESAAGSDDRAAGGEPDTPADGGVLASEVPGAEGEGASLDAAAHEAATSPLNDRREPTDAEKAAGNYPMGHPEPKDLHGLKISVENPAGSIRRSKAGVEPAWEQVMADHYGYIRGTKGADKDKIDVFVGDKPDSTRAFVVDQVNPTTGKFDEHKVILGATSIKEARELYARNYEPGWMGMGAITPMSVDGLKTWLKNGDTLRALNPKLRGDEHASEERVKPSNDLGEHPGAREGLPVAGDDRQQQAEERQGGAEAGGGDRAQHGEALGAVAEAARALREGKPEDAAAATMALDQARDKALAAGASQQDVMKAVEAPGSEAAAKARAIEDFETAKGEVKTFDKKKQAQAFIDSGKAPKNFSPRKTDDGWVLSRPKLDRSPAQKSNDKKLAWEREHFNPEKDSLGGFMGKMGGVNTKELLADGVDPKDLKGLRSGVVGKPAYRTKGGLSLDGMAELAAQHGFDVLDEHGLVDGSKLRDLIDEEMNGTRIFTPEGYEHQASLAADERDQQEKARVENEFSDDELRRGGYDDLTDEERELAGSAFDDDLDRKIAKAAISTEERGITDDEADALFGRERESVREAPEGAFAPESAEGPQGREAPQRDQDGAREDVDAARFSRKEKDRPSLDLTGETEAQIKQREALEKKAAEEKKAKEKAPAPEDFKLTGSDRPADVAEAHGQKPLFSRGPTFFSELARKLDALPQKAGDAAQWKGVIDNLATRGVKRDEIEWSGIKDWLSMQEGKVTKQQVADYLKQNGVRVEETMLGAGGEHAELAHRVGVAIEEANAAWKDLQGTLPPMSDLARANLPWWALEAERDHDSSAVEKIDALSKEVGINAKQREELAAYGRKRMLANDLNDQLSASKSGAAKFENYTLPGGKNYRELLLTLPEVRGEQKFDPAKVRIERQRSSTTQGTYEILYDGKSLGRYSDKLDVKDNYKGLSDAEIIDTARHIYENGNKGYSLSPQSGAFRSSHFDQPNILAHVRFDERTDAEGKKVLFLEELQSDWAQKGKREGFNDTRGMTAEKVGDHPSGNGFKFEVRDANGNLIRSAAHTDWFGGMTEEDALRKANSIAERPPSAPFVGKTEAWVALALKRMIRYAAENGFDKIAFTNGEQQAARYDLSKHIDTLQYLESRDDARAGETGKGTLIARKDGGLKFERVVPESELADHVGKDAAEKLLRQPVRDILVGPRRNGVHGMGRELSGLDLKVGGEGMKAFYDKIVPNVANDVLKKLGGGRVTETKFNAYEDASLQHGHDDMVSRGRDSGASQIGTQPGFDITPAMREKAMDGMPLFKRGGPEDGAAQTSDRVERESMVRRAVDPLGLKYKYAHEVGDLPADLQDQVKAEKAEGDVRGVFDPKTGDVWLIGSNIRSEGEAIFVALHESAHRGLVKLFGEDLKPVLAHIFRSNESVQGAARRLMDRYGYDQARATEEALADMALRGQARNLKGWQRFVDFIRQWVAKAGFPLKVSDQMAEHIAGAAAEAGKVGAAEGEEARFSRAAEAPAPSLIGLAEKLRAGLTDEVKQRDISRGGFREAMASMDRRMSTTDAALEKARAAADAVPVKDRWDAMHQYQTGGAGAVTDARLKPFFAMWKDMVDERLKKIQGWDEGYLKEAIPNYFSQMWKDPKGALEWYQRMVGKGPLEGGKAFLKKRTYANYREGMSWKVMDDEGGVRYFNTERDARAAAGANDVVKPPLEPISQNPVDIAQLHLQQTDKFIAMHEFRQWLKEEKGWVKRVKRGDTPPIGYGKVDDPAFRSMAVFPITDKETGKADAAAVHYDYMVPALIAKDLGNYLSKGLTQFGFWRSFRYAQNLMLSARLGFSAFHAGFTTMDTLVSHADVGARYLLDGNVSKAVETWGKALTSPISAPLEGRKLLKQFFGQAAADPNTAAVLDFLTKGGARGRMHPTDFNNSWVALRRAWSDGRIKDTALQALPAVMEGAMRPIMHYLVPWQKMTARVLLAKFELDRVAEKLGQKQGDYANIVKAMSDDAIRQIGYKVVQQVDDRLGQVAYDNLFWNKFAKDVAQASIQSVGWNVGTANVILGGLRDVGRTFKPEELVAPLDRAGRIKDANLGRVTGRLSYLISLNLTVGMMGAALNYALSGQQAQDLRDYFFPRTGRKNPDGSDERISMPSYIKDEYALSQHPVTTVQHKLHPFFSMVAELLKNEDFYGNQIVNPDDPWTKVAGQAMAYMGKSVEPYALQNAQQNRSKGTSDAMTAAPFVGITPAPSSVSRTPFEDYVTERYAAAYHQTQTPESAEHAQLKRDAINAVKQGKQPDLTPFTPGERMSIFTSARTPIQQQRYNRLSIQEKISAWDRATPQERAQFHLKVGLTRDFMLHGATLDPAVRTKAMGIISAG